ncbi:serine/threonine/tyrosine-interacting-like protein 1 isoform X4 [Grus americana]|uniref:serine/threonine/tyrosine-interacting-like protein 1 isoform X4 n=1 Tax=Grus americana TaxID=9117 RepID=UPI002407B423|nr:serine/threonine/tyrosine-interacting-like protein 1 isoform X4 [Grus americana]XP_054703629.1 serine/threonine/tyrosine-interacting-like protein 1 isoform X4 [Grus americana]
MAGMVLCEPRHLYNILNQHRRVPRLAEPSYLCLLDARTQREYDESHIITARRIEQSPTGEYLVPDSEELGCVRYCVVYDCETSSLDYDYEEEEKEKGSSAENTDSSSICSQNAEEGTAVQYARSFEQFTRHPVLILRGGYKRFSACYHFLRTQKILWMPQQELDNFQPYPVEILPAKLYMGNFKQACDQQIQKDLKIKAQVNISEQPATLFARSRSFFYLCHHLSFHRYSAGPRSGAGLLQPGDKPEQHSNHGLSYAFLPVFPEESLALRSEMQNEHETTPGLCETALRLGDPNLWDHDHRHL